MDDVGEADPVGGVVVLWGGRIRRGGRLWGLGRGFGRLGVGEADAMGGGAAWGDVGVVEKMSEGDESRDGLGVV